MKVIACIYIYVCVGVYGWKWNGGLWRKAVMVRRLDEDSLSIDDYGERRTGILR